MTGRIRRCQEPPETGYVQPGLVEVQQAEALRQLGDYTAAQSRAAEAVRAAGRCHPRGQVHRLATLATILAARGSLDAATSVGVTMRERARGMESVRIGERITMVRDAIRAHRPTAAARAFAERVSERFADSV